MTVHFSIGVYQKREGEEEWTALLPAVARAWSYVSGTGDARLRDRMIDRLRDAVRLTPPLQQELFQLPIGTELVRMPIDVKAKGGHIHGAIPLIIEPRWVSEEQQRLFVYHPTQPQMWFITENRDDLPALAQALAKEHWGELRSEERRVGKECRSRW